MSYCWWWEIGAMSRGTVSFAGPLDGPSLKPIGWRGSACSCGDAASWVLCDGVDDACTKDAIGSHNQDLAFRDACFRSSGHGKVSFKSKLIRPSTDLKRFVERRVRP